MAFWTRLCDLSQDPAEVIRDNLNTHKKNKSGFARHPLVTFHYTPTRASWLKQVRVVLDHAGQSLTGASSPSRAAQKHIDAFIESYYNETRGAVRGTSRTVHQRQRQRTPS